METTQSLLVNGKTKNPTPLKKIESDSDNEFKLWGDDRERLESLKSVKILDEF